MEHCLGVEAIGEVPRYQMGQRDTRRVDLTRATNDIRGGVCGVHMKETQRKRKKSK